MEEVKSNDGNTTAATTTAAAVLPTTPISAKSNRRRRRRERFENDNILKQALAYSRAGEASVVGTTVDAEVSKLSVTAPEAGGDEAAEIRATAAALLRRLIVDKQESLRAHFHKIPFMPQARHSEESGESVLSLVGVLYCVFQVSNDETRRLSLFSTPTSGRIPPQ